MTEIALVTAAGMAQLDADQPLLELALADRGLTARLERWDDPDAVWARYPLVVIRSTWDYTDRRDAFVAWAHRVGAVTELHNPAEAVAWNTDKRYLRDLAGQGVPTVATTWFEPGESAEIAGDHDLVVKPAVSAGAQHSARFAGDPAGARRHLEWILALGRPAMVQPYLDGIDEAGETGLVFFDGRLSHALRKGPVLEAGAPPSAQPSGPEDISARRPSDAEEALGHRVLDTLPWPDLLYARIDLAPAGDGSPVVMEVEITEPAFFCAEVDPPAIDRLAAAIARRLRSRQPS